MATRKNCQMSKDHVLIALSLSNESTTVESLLSLRELLVLSTKEETECSWLLSSWMRFFFVDID